MTNPKYELPTTPDQPQHSYSSDQPMPLLLVELVKVKARQVNEFKQQGDRWVDALPLPQQLLINSLIVIAFFLTGATLYPPFIYWIDRSFFTPAIEQQK